MNFLKATHSKVSIPLWVAPFAAVLMSLLEEPFASLFILGPSGSHKTTLAVLALCHHGNFSTSNLHTFNDSANSLEKAAFILKDAPMLVDDFYPTSNRAEQQQMISTFEKLTRSAGNRSGRGRLQTNLRLHRTFYPRGMVWFTGEDLAAVGSALVRLTLVEIEPNSIDLKMVSDLQAGKSLLPHALADFVRWLIKHQERVVKGLNEQGHQEQLSGKLRSQVHTRLPHQIVLWQRMVGVLCSWLSNHQFVPKVTIDQLLKDANSVFLENALRLQERISSSSPTEQFLEIIQSLKSAEKLWIKTQNVRNKQKQPNQEFFGWEKGDYIYAQGGVVWKLVQTYCQQVNRTFPVTERTLWEHLNRNSVLEKQNNKISDSLKIPRQENQPIRVMKFRRNRLFGSTE